MIIQFFDQKKIIFFKFVIYGPESSGKTLFFKWLANLYSLENVASISSTDGSTIFYDYGHYIEDIYHQTNLMVAVWTSAGSQERIVTRRTVIKNTDIIIFLIDSRRENLDKSLDSWREICKFAPTAPKVLVLNHFGSNNEIDAFDIRNNFELADSTLIHDVNCLSGKGINKVFEFILQNIQDFVFLRKKMIGSRK
ncbi:MAG: hypothetical protein EAX96_06065 [Candidatus Lokiarchaeota archaeon]|nr:hypothetical protein [Candidatus Lokiarchaeota archaeon]